MGHRSGTGHLAGPFLLGQFVGALHQPDQSSLHLGRLGVHCGMGADEPDGPLRHFQSQLGIGMHTNLPSTGSEPGTAVPLVDHESGEISPSGGGNAESVPALRVVVRRPSTQVETCCGIFA